MLSGVVDNEIAMIANAVLEGSFAAGDLVWGFPLHIDGTGEITVDLHKGMGDSRVTATGYYLVEADFGDITITSVPEPLSVVLLAFGSVVLLKKGKAYRS